MRNLLFCLLLLFLSACNNGANETNDTTADLEGGVAELIRNPVTANAEEIDTTKMAKLVFPEPVYEFEAVTAGTVIKHDFSFTNEGTVPLVISDVRSTCGCTVADWPREPIAPGESGVIPVEFDTKNKQGVQNKPVTITANTFPAKSVIYVNGRVNATE